MPTLADDETLLPAVVEAVQAAGRQLKNRFPVQAPPRDRKEVFAALQANDEVSLDVLRGGLERARPGVGWVEDEGGGGALPPGEWWVTDPVEGNINHIHGMTEWCVTATLVRDNTPVLTVVHLPMAGETYTALRGRGAFLDGSRLRVSAKTHLDAALVGTGQAVPDESPDTHRRMGQSITAMLQCGLLLRMSVPATLQLVHVAAGRMDAFWQYSQVRSGLLAGALLVEEAGGRLSDTQGRPWGLTSADFLAAAPGLHGAAVEVLSRLD